MSFKVTAVGAAHEPILQCPNCNHEIRLTESLAAPLLAETRQRFQEQLASKDAEMARKVEALRLEREQLAEAREQVEEQVSNRLAAERNQLIAAEAKKARDAAAAGGRRRDAPPVVESTEVDEPNVDVALANAHLDSIPAILRRAMPQGAEGEALAARLAQHAKQASPERELVVRKDSPASTPKAERKPRRSARCSRRPRPSASPWPRSRR